MADLDSHPLLITDTLAVWDVLCSGTCRHKSAEECTAHTQLVFPYRGVYVRHVGRAATVAEPNQVLFFNEDEPYRVSHPIAGGDAPEGGRFSTERPDEMRPAACSGPSTRRSECGRRQANPGTVGRPRVVSVPRGSQ